MLGDPRRLTCIGQLEQRGDELVAAEPRHHVPLAHAGTQSLRRLHQQLVADRVSEGVVDTGEAVEIHEQHCKLHVLVLRARDLTLQFGHEQTPVGQLRERVEVRVALQFGVAPRCFDRHGDAVAEAPEQLDVIRVRRGALGMGHHDQRRERFVDHHRQHERDRFRGQQRRAGRGVDLALPTRLAHAVAVLEQALDQRRIEYDRRRRARGIDAARIEREPSRARRLGNHQLAAIRRHQFGDALHHVLRDAFDAEFRQDHAVDLGQRAHRVELVAKLRRHVVERVAQFGEFVVACGLHARVELARSQPPGRRPERRERTKCPPHVRRAQEQRDQQAERDCRNENATDGFRGRERARFGLAHHHQPRWRAEVTRQEHLAVAGAKAHFAVAPHAAAERGVPDLGMDLRDAVHVIGRRAVERAPTVVEHASARQRRQIVRVAPQRLGPHFGCKRVTAVARSTQHPHAEETGVIGVDGDRCAARVEMRDGVGCMVEGRQTRCSSEQHPSGRAALDQCEGAKPAVVRRLIAELFDVVQRSLGRHESFEQRRGVGLHGLCELCLARFDQRGLDPAVEHPDRDRHRQQRAGDEHGQHASPDASTQATGGLGHESCSGGVRDRNPCPAR